MQNIVFSVYRLIVGNLHQLSFNLSNPYYTPGFVYDWIIKDPWLQKVVVHYPSFQCHKQGTSNGTLLIPLRLLSHYYEHLTFG